MNSIFQFVFYFFSAKKKNMGQKEVLERVINLINPKIEDVINDLKTEEVNYFIYYLSKRLENSLHYWENDTKHIIKNIDKL